MSTFIDIAEWQPDDELSPYVRALIELDEPRDELGFLVRVGFAEQIAYWTMQRIDRVSLEPINSDVFRDAKSGADFLRLAKTARMKEDWAREWEGVVQSQIPIECGLRFYIVREMLAGNITVGFRFGEWDTANFIAQPAGAETKEGA